MKRIVLLAVIFLCGCFFWKEGKNANLLYGDGLGYYVYLPATFIYDNHRSIGTLPTDRGISPDIHNYVAQMEVAGMSENGTAINQYTYGVALMEAPFFFTAHLYEVISGGRANGFSGSYAIALRLASFFYCFMGMWLLARSLSIYFSRQIVYYTLMLLLIGTNLFWFTFYQAGMAHVILFFLYACMIRLTLQVYERPRWWVFGVLGLVAGLITLIRPTDLICLAIPVLFNPSGKFIVTEKIRFVRRHFRKIILGASCFILPIIPQFIYWKLLSGYWLYDSYGTAQTFDFARPRILYGLFSAENGWLLYSPLLLFSLAGLLLIRHYRPFALTVWVITPIYIWVTYAWFLPNYINGLGSRPMIHIYPLLAFPFAAFLTWIHHMPRVAQIAAGVLTLFFVSVNISFSFQKAWGILDSEYANYPFVRQTMYQRTLRYEDLVVHDLGHSQPNPEDLRLVAPPLCAFPIDSTAEIDQQGNIFYRLSGGMDAYTPFNITLSYDTSIGQAQWAKCSGIFKNIAGADDKFESTLMTFEVQRADSFVFWKALRVNNKIGRKHTRYYPLYWYILNEWGVVDCYLALPDDLRHGDRIRLLVWNQGHSEVLVKNICLSFWADK